MQECFNFLKALPVNYLATVSGGVHLAVVLLATRSSLTEKSIC